jgi:broad specificity phosphatase PhoE
VSTLVLVRHGKASPLSSDYDNLSEIGVEQSRLLGEEWASTGARFDAVYVGPRRRHAQTLDAAKAAYVARSPHPWPDAVMLPELDEHDGMAVVMKTLQAGGGGGDAAAAMAKGETPALNDVLALFKDVTRRWVRGAVSAEGIEDWPAFRARVGRGVDAMTEGLARGKTIVAFTSAGAVAAAVGNVLGVADDKVLELSWSLHNGSTSELAFSEAGWGLRTFNATPHLRGPRLLTSV